LSIVQGPFSAAPCQTPCVTIRKRCASLHHPTLKSSPPRCASMRQHARSRSPCSATSAPQNGLCTAASAYSATPAQQALSITPRVHQRAPSEAALSLSQVERTAASAASCRRAASAHSGDADAVSAVLRTSVRPVRAHRTSCHTRDTAASERGGRSLRGGAHG
jgi:hypothetical protein